MEIRNLIKNEFVNQLEKRLGYPFDEKYIYTDELGWNRHIHPKALHTHHPVILHHYNGGFMVMIPCEDMKNIEDQTLSVAEYIDSSVWSFGYYWGGGSIIGGVYWQILENGKLGFTNVEMIRRYMFLLACRGNRSFEDNVPPQEMCARCPVERCPISKLESKAEGASWDDAVNEHDARRDLYQELKRVVYERFGLKLTGLGSCVGNPYEAQLYYNMLNPGEVFISLQQELLIKLLYHPENYNTKLLAEGFEIKAMIRSHFVGSAHTAERSKLITGGVDQIYEFWSEDPYFCWLKKTEPVEKSSKFKDLFCNKIKSAWYKLLGK